MAMALAALLREQGGCAVGFRRGISSESASVHIKALRERTGAPFRDVKAALQRCGWDAGTAFFFLCANLTLLEYVTSGRGVSGALALV